MRFKVIACSTLVALLPLGASAAGKATPLTAGGRTIAGPGSALLQAGGSLRVFNEPSANRDRCATVAVVGSSAVQLTLTDGGNATQSIDVLGGTSASLCRQSTKWVDLACTGASSCNVQWRVDND